MTAWPTHDALAKNVNTTFRIRVGDSEIVETELTEVSEQVLSPNQERFSAVFRGPKDKFLGQGLHHFEHPELKNFDLFIVPVGQDDRGTYYEAIFNRLLSYQSPQASGQ